MLFYFSGSQADYSAPSASGGCTGGDRIVRFASGRVRTVGAGSPSTHLCLRTHTKTIQAQKKKQSKVFKYRAPECHQNWLISDSLIFSSNQLHHSQCHDAVQNKEGIPWPRIFGLSVGW